MATSIKPFHDLAAELTQIPGVDATCELDNTHHTVWIKVTCARCSPNRQVAERGIDGEVIASRVGLDGAIALVVADVRMWLLLAWEKHVRAGHVRPAVVFDSVGPLEASTPATAPTGLLTDARAQEAREILDGKRPVPVTDHPYGADAVVELRDGVAHVDGLSLEQCLARMERRGRESIGFRCRMKDCKLTPGQERAARISWAKVLELRQLQEREAERTTITLDTDYDVL